MKTGSGRLGFRADVEGLRAVAIVTVLLAHARVPLAAGGFIGVDVFFVISGFLITRLLLAELDATSRLRVGMFYARRIKRLLPLAVTVLAAVTLLSALLLSPVRADTVSGDLEAAGAYAVNWRFSAQAVDYFAPSIDESPLQHFWSLAVEEQFYLVWPALLIAATWWHRRRGASGHGALWFALGAVAVASFAYALWLTGSSPEAAYFSTPARAWELALGGLLALVLVTRRPGRRTASAAALGGIAAIGVAVVTFNGGTAFPAVPALLPTLGAAALILAGAAAEPPWPVRMLACAPVQSVGRISYAWYLWHWPVLVLAAAAWGPLPLGARLLAVGVSAVPTVLSHRWIERPCRRSTIHVRWPRATLAMGPACAGAALVLGLLLSLSLPSVRTLAATDARGAAALRLGRALQRSADALRPTPRKASKDRSRAYSDGCLVPPRGSRSPSCVYANRMSRRTLVLFGDSHALEYFPAMLRIADRRGWRLVVLTKAGCPPPLVTVITSKPGRTYRECDTWRRRALERIAAIDGPTLVVMSGQSRYTLTTERGRVRRHDSGPALTDGYVSTLRRVRRTAKRIVVIRDSPRPPFDVPSCVSQHLHHLARCAVAKHTVIREPSVAARAVARVRGVRLINPTSRYCLKRRCPAVIGGVLVYRNAGHITATYMSTLAPWLDRRLPSL